MSSDRRIRASQANGAKSRGPKTPEGKRRSSRNNLRHGLLARNVVLFSEDSKAFSKLLAQFEDTFQPQDPVALSLVETMAVARWCSPETFTQTAESTVRCGASFSLPCRLSSRHLFVVKPAPLGGFWRQRCSHGGIVCRSSRARAMETGVRRYEIRNSPPGKRPNSQCQSRSRRYCPGPSRQAGLAFRSLAGGARLGIDFNTRHEARHERQFARADDLLRKHQEPEKIPNKKKRDSNLFPFPDTSRATHS